MSLDPSIWGWLSFETDEPSTSSCPDKQKDLTEQQGKALSDEDLNEYRQLCVHSSFRVFACSSLTSSSSCSSFSGKRGRARSCRMTARAWTEPGAP